MNLEVYRKEVKYIITLADYYRMETCLSACLTRDPNDKGDGYDIRSLYFDSYRDDDCRDVLDGLENKQKIRIRVYDPRSATAKLEYKCKTGTDGLKLSIRITRREVKKMLEGDYDFLMNKGDAGKELYTRMVKEVYLPKTMVRYNRRAYMYNSNNVRVTFDTGIEASPDKWALLEMEPCLEPVFPVDVGVLEVKYNGFLFSFIKDIIENVNALPMANSKYVQARLMY